ncbi:hypothetical protein ACLB1T_21725 [Escherichia coli]
MVTDSRLAKRSVVLEAQGVKQLLWGNRIRALPGPEYHLPVSIVPRRWFLAFALAA